MFYKVAQYAKHQGLTLRYADEGTYIAEKVLMTDTGIYPVDHHNIRQPYRRASEVFAALNS